MPAGLLLVAPIRASTWLGREPDGMSVTARRLLDPVAVTDTADPVAEEGSVSMIERAEALASVRAPSLLRARGVQRVDGALWLVSELGEGVWLNRLLELTRPRAGQAVVIGLGVLSGLRTLHAAGYAHGGLCAGEVRVGGDGRIRLGGWAPGALDGAEPLEQRQRADLAAVGVLLTQLGRAAHRSPGHAQDDAPAQLAALDAAAGTAACPGADIELMVAPLEAVCGPDEDAAATSELAVLAHAATGSGSVSSAGTTRRPPSAALAAQSPRASSAHGPAARLGAWLRDLWKRSWTWTVALLALVAIVSLEFALLHDRLAQDLHLLRVGGQPERSVAAGSTPVDLPPVPSPAPANAGPVAGLDLRSVTSCTPGAMCAVRVLIQLHPQPAPSPQAVAWAFQVIDRCTETRFSVPGGAVSAAPGADQVQAVSTVALPPGRALAVIAVTGEPSKAASGPLLVPARDGSC